MKFWLYLIGIISVLIGMGWGISRDLLGAGSFKRMVTISGVYAVCRPANYDVVCFLDADSKEGGMFCMPLSQVGGVCK